MHGANRGKAMRRTLSILAAVLALGCALAGAVRADDDDDDTRPSNGASIWQRKTLTGDWGGARAKLYDQGFKFRLDYAGDFFGVLSGGVRHEAIYEHRLDFGVEADLKKLIGWQGATAQFTLLQIANSGYSVSQNTGAISDPSDIVALPSTRLFTAWIEQKFNDRVALRVGQLSADEEFFRSPTAEGLLNGTFGWASSFAANMTNAGPAYPLAVPGVRVQAKLTERLTLLSALFAGDPAGRNCNDDPQICNRYGTTFSLNGGALWMGELQYQTKPDKKGIGLPSVYKLGVWYATTNFADQHYGLDSFGNVVSLADPAAAGPLNHSGNWGLYGVADQTVWAKDERAVSLFVRAGASPSGRNLISFYVDGGIGLKGLLPKRDDDTLTFGVSYAKISRDAAALDLDTLAVNGPPYPIRDYELVFEASYQWMIAPWWTVQPDLQYIVHPGGNVPNPNNPTATIGNAFVAGIRTGIKF